MILAPIVEIFSDINELYKNYTKEFSNKLSPFPQEAK